MVPTATMSSGPTYLIGGPTSPKLKPWLRNLNVENKTDDQVTVLSYSGILLLISSQSLKKGGKFSYTSFSTGGFFVTGINLTEDLKYICSHPTESLKDMVMSTYPTLLGWVRQQKPGSRTGSLNIIAGDFVTESKFVPTVIALNEHLLDGTTWLVFTMHIMFDVWFFFIPVMDFFTSQVWQIWLCTCDVE